MSDHEFLGEEHPESDRVQLILLVILIIVWIVDSFLLRWGTIIQVPLFVRMGLSIVFLGVGVYFIQRSHKLVIEANESGLVDWGVYSISRHPMYLGSMLFELGIVISTLSIPALIVWVIIFFAYNLFAAYEENSLLEVIGDEYRQYQRKVRRWGLF